MKVTQQSVCILSTSNLGHFVFDRSQAEYVLRCENGAFINECVVNSSEVACTQNKTHGALLNADQLQVDID